MLSVLPYLRFPSLFQLCFPVRRLCSLPDLELDAFSGSQHFALQVEATSFCGIILVKQILESLHHIFHIRLTTLRWLDVEYLAGFVKREPRGSEVVCIS